MEEEYTVMCAILGRDEVFSVEISSKTRVSALKNKIRETEFRHLSSFQATELKFYKVNIPALAYGTLIDSISQRSIKFDGDVLLDPFMKLSNIPGGFLEDNLHI